MTDLDLDAPFPLATEQIERYRQDGFVKLERVLGPESLHDVTEELRAQVAGRNPQAKPMAERTTYEKAFVQVTNLWTRSEAVKRFVCGRRLARIAAELMGTRGVRLYHDQALYKEAGGGITPWHADQYYWPLSSDLCCTAWVPLQDTPLEMGPVAFAPGSQRFEYARELPISDESEAAAGEALLRAGYAPRVEPFERGDVSFHSGWTFHRAGENRSDRCREVMTIIYIDASMRLAAPRNPNQQADREAWCPGVAVGEPFASPLNPVLYRSA